MENKQSLLRGGIRQKIFSMLLITIVLIIAAYTAVFLYQTAMVEKLVNDTYEEQKQVYIENGLGAQYVAFRDSTLASFHNKMFHARNILFLLIVSIVAAGMAFAFSITKRIIDPLNTITRRVASLGVRNRQFQMEDIYKTGDEIEVLAESFAKQSARTMLYIDEVKRVTAEKERIGAELDMAKKIQASQLPRNFDTFCVKRDINLYACIGVPDEDDEYLTTNSRDFHEHLGYKTVGTFRNSGRKFGRWYSMIWMEKLIGEHTARPSEVMFKDS